MQPRKLLSGAAFLLAIGVSSSAMATVSVVRGNDPSDIENNILFDSGQSCANQVACSTTGILGDINAGPQDAIRFTSSTDILVTQASGQAMLSSADFVNNAGQVNDQNGINQLTVTGVNPIIGFEAFQLAFNGEAGTVINFSVADQLLPSPTNFTFTLVGNTGGDRFTFNTDAAQYITSLSFTSNAGVTVSLEDVRQVRVGALVLVPGPLAGAGLPALVALGGFVWARRRQAGAVAA